MSQDGFETIKKMKLNHLPNEAELVMQRQRNSYIPKDKFQFGIPTTFVSPENGETVWNSGPSIQLEQIPELIEMLRDVYERYSGDKDPKAARTCTVKDVFSSVKNKLDKINPKAARTCTFADVAE